MPLMKVVTIIALLAISLGACDASSPDANSLDGLAEVQARMDEIAGQVSAWRDAPDLATATTAAEAAANLVVGPGGPGYGDRNGDGIMSGETDTGLLPGLDGTPEGLLIAGIGDIACLQPDVLGGEWDDPSARWAELTTAIAEWSPTNNTFPSLASHPMRIVGWATLTQTATLDDAHEYAGHAALHVNVADTAIAGC
jgi:hypothetical protein